MSVRMRITDMVSLPSVQALFAALKCSVKVQRNQLQRTTDFEVTPYSVHAVMEVSEEALEDAAQMADLVVSTIERGAEQARTKMLEGCDHRHVLAVIGGWLDEREDRGEIVEWLTFELMKLVDKPRR